MNAILAVALIAATTLTLKAQTGLWSQHADLGVSYEGGAWDLHVHHHALGEFEPGEVILGVDIVAALKTVPAGAPWSFLGAAGSPVWILPQTHDDNLLFLGLGTEELAAGLFAGDQVTLALKAVTGPGRFALYRTDAFGTPAVFMNSGDGIDAEDAVTLPAGSHAHVNWAFSAPGAYQIDFEGAGTLAEGNVFTSSGPVTYTFRVAAVPEPATLALIGLGTLSLIWQTRRRHGPRRSARRGIAAKRQDARRG